MDRSFERLNDESRERLAALVATLTPTQLSIDLGEGWTVASALAHTGFWDRWQASRWEQMLAGKWSADDESVIEAEHLANDSLHPYWAGIAATDVPKLALDAATRLDALIASAPDEIVAKLEGGPSAYLLHRHNHRGDHVDHIERAIAEAAEEATDGSFAAKNAASRRRLAAVVERLRAEDMALPTETTEEGSWTIAQVLGHLAFWDRSLETRWQMARDAGDAGGAGGAGRGPIEPTYFPGGATEAINRPLAELVGSWSERLGPAVGAEAVAAAESLDAVIEELAPRLPAGTVSVTPRVLNRWIHREAHLDQIERGLVARRPAAAAATDVSFRDRNDASRARLTEFVESLTAEDAARAVGDGSWTVGMLLGHMAFWDRFLAARWRTGLASGATAPISVTHEVADLLNDALPTQWAALAAAGVEALRAEVVAAADEVDSVIGSLPASVPTDAILAERPAVLDRSLHRVEHLADLDKALGR
jgi:uncharacterized damage-inducible protein DinB